MRRRPQGWSPPGPVPPGPELAVANPALAPGPGETLDCLSGHWKIFQLRRGHRYSTDDLLTAWFAMCGRGGEGVAPRTQLDLGCGVGSVGLLCLWRHPRLRLVGIEAQARSAALARRSLRYNGVADRAEIRTGDLREVGVLAPSEQFDLVTGSPPYLNPREGRRSGLPQRGPCRFEDRGGARDYLRTAAAHLAEGGTVVWCHATRYAGENLEAARAAGLAVRAWRPVAFREGRESLISLFRARRREGPCSEGPPLVVRRADGTWSEEFRGIRATMGFPA